jgi:hypothetical protein
MHKCAIISRVSLAAPANQTGSACYSPNKMLKSNSTAIGQWSLKLLVNL